MMRRVLFGAFFVALCGCFACVSFVRAETTTTADITDVMSTPLILQMADGHFYSPALGRIANTREELICELTGQSCPAVVPPPAGGAPVVPSVPSVPTEPVVAPSSTPSLIELAVERGKKLLQDQLDADLKAHPKPQTAATDSGYRKVRLAIWDPATDLIQTWDVMKDGTKLKLPDGAPKIRVAQTNGLNSHFVVENNRVVVALRYPIYRKVVVSKKKFHFSVADVVYTPYSDALATPEMVAAGKRVLNSLVGRVYQEMQTDQAHSWAFPDRLVSDVVDPDVAKAIAVIEHSDNAALDRDPAGTINKFFVTLAANADAAYAYSGSSAGALGLAQFIPSTYTKLVKQRPELHLIADFEDGMRDLHNAITAQVGYLDVILAALPDAARSQYTDAVTRSRVEEYMTAAYNGGPARVSKAMARWDEMWSSDPNNSITALRAKRQTVLAQISTFKSKVKKETVAAKKKQLKSQLAAAETLNNQLIDRIEYLKVSGLKAETLAYITKYRQVIDVIGDRAVAVAMAE